MIHTETPMQTKIIHFLFRSHTHLFISHRGNTGNRQERLHVGHIETRERGEAEREKQRQRAEIRARWALVSHTPTHFAFLV